MAFTCTILPSLCPFLTALVCWANVIFSSVRLFSLASLVLIFVLIPPSGKWQHYCVHVLECVRFKNKKQRWNWDFSSGGFFSCSTNRKPASPCFIHRIVAQITLSTTIIAMVSMASQTRWIRKPQQVDRHMSPPAWKKIRKTMENL